MNIKEFGWEGKRGSARSAKDLGGELRIPRECRKNVMQLQANTSPARNSKIPIDTGRCHDERSRLEN